MWNAIKRIEVEAKNKLVYDKAMDDYKSEKKKNSLLEEKAKREEEMNALAEKSQVTANKKRLGRPIMVRSYLGPDEIIKEKSVENEGEKEFNKYFKE